MDLYQAIETWSSLPLADLKSQLELHPELLSATDISGNYLPHILCEQKNYALLLDLYRLKGDLIGLCQNASKKTVLHLLARTKCADVFEGVLAACPCALSVTDNCGRLPAHLALMHEVLPLVGVLFARYHSYFDPLLQDNDGESALSLFSEKFFLLQKFCWEEAVRGHIDTYNTMKAAAEVALSVVKREKLTSTLPHICDIRVMKELKISILHEVASDSTETVLQTFLLAEKGLGKYTDMSGMCPLMRVLASPKPEVPRIRALLSAPFALFDINKRSLLHHALSNRSLTTSEKEALFELICAALSQQELRESFTAVDKTGHTLLSLATAECSLEFVSKTLSVYMRLLHSWEDLYAKDAPLLEDPLISAMKSHRADVVVLLFTVGFSLFQPAKGQTSALFTLFRVPDSAMLATCVDYCTRDHRSSQRAFAEFLQRVMDSPHSGRLSAAISPVLPLLQSTDFDPLSFLTFGFVVQCITQHDVSGATLVISYHSTGRHSEDLIRYSLFVLLAYREYLAVEVLLRVPVVARVLTTITDGKDVSILYAQELLRYRAALLPDLLNLGFRVVMFSENQATLAQFLYDIILTRGKSYGHIRGLFSLLDNAPAALQHDIETALIKESSLFANITYDMILFFTNVLKLYRKYSPIWTAVLIGVFREDEVRGSRLIFSVTRALCQDGLVQLPMGLLSQYAEAAAGMAAAYMQPCDHCGKITSSTERRARKVQGDIVLTDHRNELFFLINALESCEADICESWANQSYASCTLREVLEILIRNLRWNAANKLYSNRPYRYLAFVREWFEALPLCTCYIGGNQVEN